MHACVNAMSLIYYWCCIYGSILPKIKLANRSFAPEINSSDR